jgi:YHS domain-containing protein
MPETIENIDSTEEVKDSICGMTTESLETFIPYEHQGEKFYFCSKHCLEKRRSHASISG